MAAWKFMISNTAAETYDQAYAGRNRRYYKITSVGIAQLSLYKEEWKQYSQRISGIFEGGERV